MYRIHLPYSFPPMSEDQKKVHGDLVALINGPEPTGTGFTPIQETLERVGLRGNHDQFDLWVVVRLEENHIQERQVGFIAGRIFLVQGILKEADPAVAVIVAARLVQRHEDGWALPPDRVLDVRREVLEQRNWVLSQTLVSIK